MNYDESDNEGTNRSGLRRSAQNKWENMQSFR